MRTIYWSGSGELAIRQGGDSKEGNVIITPGKGEKVLDYQVEIICRNPHPRYLPLDIQVHDNDTSLRYQVRNAISLQSVVTGRKIAWQELLRIIENIIEGLQECRKYFLHSHCILLDSSWIFINPTTQEAALIYLPLALAGNCEEGLRLFLKKLLEEVSIEEQEAYNLLFYRLLQGVVQDVFSMAEFSQLLKEVKYPMADLGKKKSAEAKPFCLVDSSAVSSIDKTKAGNRQIDRIKDILRTLLSRYYPRLSEETAKASGEEIEKTSRPVMAREMRNIIHNR